MESMELINPIGANTRKRSKKQPAPREVPLLQGCKNTAFGRIRKIMIEKCTFQVILSLEEASPAAILNIRSSGTLKIYLLSKEHLLYGRKFDL